MEVTVMSRTTDTSLFKWFSKFDRVGDWVSEATRFGEIYMTSAQSLSANVLARIGSVRLSRLNVVAHGSPQRVLFGNDLIEVGNFRRFENFFKLLRGRFTPDGFVHLQICEVGQNFVLLTLFAQAFGVPVVAGQGDESSLYRFNWKKYNKCDPSGSCKVDLKRP
jgi:hypothetical protein